MLQLTIWVNQHPCSLICNSSARRASFDLALSSSTMAFSCSYSFRGTTPARRASNPELAANAVAAAPNLACSIFFSSQDKLCEGSMLASKPLVSRNYGWNHLLTMWHDILPD